jgi:hypothetical protein
MEGHHLILGRLKDFLTGEELEETHDEQYRQKIARLLVRSKGFSRDEIKPRHQLEVRVGENRAKVPVDFLVSLDGRIIMLIKYGPGSLVTRERSALAASRLVAEYQIPWVVVTNGEDAHILDGHTGKLVSTGLQEIPGKASVVNFDPALENHPLSSKRVEMEARLLYVYEVDGACPCDTTICRLNN